MENKIERIKQLVEELNKYSFEYYVLDNPSILDKEYDKKYDELVALEQETNHIDSNSPTQRVGDRILEGLPKVNHAKPLLSLDKAQAGENKLQKFCKDCETFCKQNKLPKPKYSVTKKYDGLTLKSDYDNSNLERCSTRGTGTVGEDVTEQAKVSIVNLPKQIKFNDKISVSGEAVMTKHAFNEYNKNAETPLKNLRNGASGTLRNFNLANCKQRKLHAFFYNINDSNLEFETYSQQLEFIKEQGLPTTDYVICESYEEIMEEINKIEDERNSLQYDIDGVVIAIDDIKTRELMGFTIKFPKWAIAHKFEADEEITKVLDVEFRVGRTGKITPRALIEPVELSGANVKYATLNNMDDIERKGVKIGCDVKIRRSNDVIPEILEAINDEGIEIKIPKVCPSCQTELIRNGVHYFCPNSINCKPQLFKAIVHYCQREAMNIEGFSEKGAELFLESNIIDNILDLYKLESKKSDIIKLPKFGLKKYNNLIQSIENSKQCDLNSFILGLGIEGIGKKTSKDLANNFKTMKDLAKATFNDLVKIRDVGDTTANALITFFGDAKNLTLVNELLGYITFKDEVKVEVTNGIFEGKSVYCTGSFAIAKKDELKKMVEDNGGNYASGYAKSLGYLVIGSLKGSSKEDKAKTDNSKGANIQILTEEQFLKMIGR